MIFGKKNRKYIENNMAEMLALVGGAMEDMKSIMRIIEKKMDFIIECKNMQIKL